MLAQTGPEKAAMFARLLQSLDILSTYKITSLLITREHFKEVIIMFVTKETSELLLTQISGVEVENCGKCADSYDRKSISVVIVALRILCRALNF